jgi:protein-S-isoprenylcysteine O-methyltransferase Ste14
MSTDDKKQEAKSKVKKQMDLIDRGVKEPSPIGSTVFVGLRALDPLLQYGILKHGYGQRLLHGLGLETLPAGLPTNTGVALIDKLGLSPYRLILLGMSAGSAAKQIYWLLGTSQEMFPPGAAVTVSAYNAIVNSINSLLFTTTLASASLSGSETFPQPPLVVGATLYIVGILVEAIAETQRAAFKRKPENKGKPYTGGLWKFARHINYGGYTLWRAGYATAAGGWIWGAMMFAWQFYDFSQRAVPVLNDYCEKRVSGSS